MDMLPVDSIDSTPEVLNLGGDEVTIVATCAQTNDDLFAVEVRMPPGGGPPLLHRHAPSEVYRVLRGEFTFYVEDEPGGPVRRVAAGPGAVVPLAGGTPHSVRNESAAEAVAFVVHTPGPVMEGFIRAVAALTEAESADMATVLAVAAANGVEMLGPIPA
ncbi:cupin domain-containing protein [Spirilliplanes yamanashiensis]|uniref:Cupin type-2 domain-containing protein n=1 Tax=Spirilliplanes yamanashiensis TaxID=42233 RepID=A0A8J3YAK8_9ACTN|nr:cupin domain-containing protein [Spirilliplanes yamanashiensis]MDP9815981.1 mannose-6-phosphate isomerase-like protein (cupin superfamily) [Spirilliplanes yamanashiensis]GIJ04238.1 hypothetical protein Sya03_35900 [Spirilliplanes yamanashiensis]